MEKDLPELPIDLQFPMPSSEIVQNWIERLQIIQGIYGSFYDLKYYKIMENSETIGTCMKRRAWNVNSFCFLSGLELWKFILGKSFLASEHWKGFNTLLYKYIVPDWISFRIYRIRWSVYSTPLFSRPFEGVPSRNLWRNTIPFQTTLKFLYGKTEERSKNTIWLLKRDRGPFLLQLKHFKQQRRK